MKPGRVLSQQIESPTVPIVRTVLEYPEATLVLTTFATNEPADGRVNNVIADVMPQSNGTVNMELLTEFDTLQKYDMEETGGVFTVLDRSSREVLLVGKALASDVPAGAPLRVPAVRLSLFPSALATTQNPTEQFPITSVGAGDGALHQYVCTVSASPVRLQ